MNIRYMFDKHDFTKYEFLKEFLNKIKSTSLTVVPKRDLIKGEVDEKENIKKVLCKYDAMWNTYYYVIQKRINKKIYWTDSICSKNNIIFIDPDTGIALKEKGDKTHVTVTEIEEMLKWCPTLVIYQHRLRENIRETLTKKIKLIKDRTGKADTCKVLGYAKKRGNKFCGDIGFIVIVPKEIYDEVGEFKIIPTT